MSQHFFGSTYNEEPINILMGWDKPLQGFFMVIERPDCDEDTPLWSNLEQLQDAHPKTLDLFLEVLNNLNIKLPDNMIEELVADKLNNVGNKMVKHAIRDGEYTRCE